MKLSKNTWTIIAIVGVIVLIYWLMTKNKKENKESGYTYRGGRNAAGNCARNQVRCDCIYGETSPGVSGYSCIRSGTSPTGTPGVTEQCCTMVNGRLVPTGMVQV